MTMRWLARGALAGFVWGVAARLWMRFISTDPEFSWGGTAYIVLVPTLIGSMMGIVIATRRPWARVVGTIVVVPLGVAAGTIMLPTIMFGSLSYSRRTLPRWARVVFGVLASIPVLFVSSQALQEHGWIKACVAIAAYLCLCAGMIAMASISIGSSRNLTANSHRAETMSAA